MKSWTLSDSRKIGQKVITRLFLITLLCIETRMWVLGIVAERICAVGVLGPCLRSSCLAFRLCAIATRMGMFTICAWFLNEWRAVTLIVLSTYDAFQSHAICTMSPRTRRIGVLSWAWNGASKQKCTRLALFGAISLNYLGCGLVSANFWTAATRILDKLRFTKGIGGPLTESVIVFERNFP